jgi:hypothetical protein
MLEMIMLYCVLLHYLEIIIMENRKSNEKNERKEIKRDKEMGEFSTP